MAAAQHGGLNLPTGHLRALIHFHVVTQCGVKAVGGDEALKQDCWVHASSSESHLVSPAELRGLSQRTWQTIILCSENGGAYAGSTFMPEQMWSAHTHRM